MREGYNAQVEFCSKELDVRERIKIKDTSNAQRIDELLENGTLTVDIDYFAVVNVHNERAKQDKDYSQLILVDKGGNQYSSGSNSLIEAVEDIYEELADAGITDFVIDIFRKQSKNHAGKYFITCALA